MVAPILSSLGTEILIPVCAVIGIVFALFQWIIVSKVKLSASSDIFPSTDCEHNRHLMEEEEEGINNDDIVNKCAEIQSAISEGATSFLLTEYKYVGAFMVAFAILIFLFLGSVEGFSTSEQSCTHYETRICKPALATAIFSTVSFLLGAITSLVSGFLG